VNVISKEGGITRWIGAWVVVGSPQTARHPPPELHGQRRHLGADEVVVGPYVDGRIMVTALGDVR
jgi:hypothetical protein